MKPNYLSVSGFKAYDDETELELGNVAACAVTGPNGAGKSSLFDAMLWSLYGDTGRVLSDEVVNSDGSGKCRVEFRFSDTLGRIHQVVRTRTRSGSASVIYEGPDGRLNQAKEVFAQIADVLRADSERLAMTAWARQGEAGALASLSPANRRQRLLEIVLPSGLFDEAAETLGDLVKQKESDRLLAENEVERLVNLAGTIDVLLDSETASVAKVEQSRKTLSSSEKKRDARLHKSMSAGDWKTLERLRVEASQKGQLEKAARIAIKKAETEKRKSEELSQEAEQATARIEASENAEQKARKEHQSFLEKQAAASADASSASERIKMLRRGEGECWTCGADLSGGKAEELIAELESKIAKADKAKEVLSASSRKLKEAESASAKSRDVRRDFERQAARSAQESEKQKASADKAEEKLKLINQNAERLEELEAVAQSASNQKDVQQAESSVKNAKEVLEKALLDLGSIRSKLQQARNAEEELPVSEERKAKVLKSLEAAEIALKGARPSGIQNIILTDQLAAFQRATKDALYLLGDMDISFQTSSETRRNPPMEIIVSRNGSEPRRYETLSGGEKMRVDVALRIGLCRVAGVQIRTLVLDEGWGALDSEGTSNLSTMLTGLVKSGEMEAIYTITHVDDAAAGFEHRIEVNRQGRSSHATLEIA